MEPVSTWQPDEDQTAAIRACVDPTKRVVAVSGAAGTGKTSIMQRVFDTLVDAGWRVAQCAPTGKAAKRIQEATGRPATTMHKLLEYTHPGEPDPKTGKVDGESHPRRHRGNPLELDIILADEYAMVPSDVHRNLIDALPPGGCIRCFGDLNQLPPIIENWNPNVPQPPSPFSKMIREQPSFVLSKIYRQGEGSAIIQAGHDIIRGRMPKRLPGEFDMEFKDSPIPALTEYVLDMLDKGIDFSSPDHQIITPTNQTFIGTRKLNPIIQAVFRPETEGWFNIPRHPWQRDKNITCRVRKGDKVIYTMNNYELALFNGETGIVVDGSEYGEIVIDLGDREVVVPPLQSYVVNGKTKEFDPRLYIDLAYVLTTHKCQGSQYGSVIYMMNKSIYFKMLNRKNLYTGCSRAEKSVMVFTDQRALSSSLGRIE